MSEIVLENITKTFGKVVAVENVNLKVRKEEFLTLLGPSGCGKTTALRIVAGLEKPNEGNVYIDGNRVNDLQPGDRNIAMVFQSYALYPHKTVYENIAFPLKIRKVPKDELTKKVKEVASMLGMEELLNRKPKELSGGQRQRVALGRAIVRSPNAFLMDEPLSNLDAKLRVQMRVELKKLQSKLGITTIYVTHDQIEAMTMSDRVVLMNNGKIMQIDTSKEVYSHPDNVWVAGFMGTPPMNFLECIVETKNGHDTLTSEDFKLSIPGKMAKVIGEKTEDRKVVLGFRPEDATLTFREEEGAVKTKVYAIEPIGDALLVDLLIGQNVIKVRVRPDLELQSDSEVYLKIILDKVHLFDKKSQQKILYEPV